MISLDLNIFTVGMIVCAATIAWMFQMLWYSFFLFGKGWINVSLLHIEKSRRFFVVLLLDGIVLFFQTYTIAWLLENFEAWTFLDACMVVSITGIAFIILPLFTMNLWEQHSWKLFLIHVVGVFITFFLMAIILIYGAL